MNVELQVTSPAFRADEAIPPEYTCDGRSITPPLAWSTVPSNTRSIAVLVEDPDASRGSFTHWLVTGIPPTTTALSKDDKLPDGAMVGRNGKGVFGYTGPCPSSGRHHYYLRVYALDMEIARPESRSVFLAAIDGHVLAEGELVGTYQKITPP